MYLKIIIICSISFYDYFIHAQLKFVVEETKVEFIRYCPSTRLESKVGSSTFCFMWLEASSCDLCPGSFRIKSQDSNVDVPLFCSQWYN
jgi:hypothetical protein